MAKKKDGSAAGGAGRDEGRDRAPLLLGAGDTMGRDARGRPVPAEQDIELFTYVSSNYDQEALEAELEQPMWAGEDMLADFPTEFGRVMSKVDPNWQQLEGEPYEAVVAEAGYLVLMDVYGRY